jgi:hypothetical protein
VNPSLQLSLLYLSPYEAGRRKREGFHQITLRKIATHRIVRRPRPALRQNLTSDKKERTCLPHGAESIEAISLSRRAIDFTRFWRLENSEEF